MPIFSQILNAIPEVVNLNQRPNSATNSETSQRETISEIDSWVSPVRQVPSMTSTYSTPFTEAHSDFSQGENSGTESDSTQSIPTRFLPLKIRYFQDRGTSEIGSDTGSDVEIDSNTHFQYRSSFVPPSALAAPAPPQNQVEQGGGTKDLKNLPLSMSEDVLKALRQFGLEGCMMPLPSNNKGPQESNSFPRLRLGPGVGVPTGVDAGGIHRKEDICGDNSGNGEDKANENDKVDVEEWMSPLSISGTMLTGLLNRFTTGGAKVANQNRAGAKTGTSDAESSDAKF